MVDTSSSQRWTKHQLLVVGHFHQKHRITLSKESPNSPRHTTRISTTKTTFHQTSKLAKNPRDLQKDKSSYNHLDTTFFFDFEHRSYNHLCQIKGCYNGTYFPIPPWCGLIQGLRPQPTRQGPNDSKELYQIKENQELAYTTPSAWSKVQMQPCSAQTKIIK